MHFKITTCTKESQGFQNLDVIIMLLGWKTYDLWLTCSWFNISIYSLSNLKFEIKIKFSTCFNYIKIKINYN
jgi:hypothetical protein